MCVLLVLGIKCNDRCAILVCKFFQGVESLNLESDIYFYQN